MRLSTIEARRAGRGARVARRLREKPLDALLHDWDAKDRRIGPERVLEFGIPLGRDCRRGQAAGEYQSHESLLHKVCASLKVEGMVPS